MPRRAAAVLLAVLALAATAPAPAAHAQADPFGDLPQGSQQPTPTPAPVETDPSGGGDLGRTALYAIFGGLVVAFVGIGVWIARDARGRVPQRHAAKVGQLREEGPHRHARESKAKARAKARRARASRKRNR
jgi:hypothetical protein